ncbi:MAG: Flp pilus assembly complex ATPase component TadA [SAR324 cluster bacterium]|nr:Flp pilus assembly complex ATPase component TadA [SAR324 cluster bacterium]
MKGKSLGEMLVDRGFISEEQLGITLREQKRTGKLLGEILIQHGFVREKDLSEVLASQSGRTFIDIKNAEFPADAASMIPERFARDRLVVPISMGQDMFLVAMANAFDIETIDELQKMSGRYIDVVQATETDILTALDRCYFHEAAQDDVTLEELIAAAESNIGAQKGAASDEGGIKVLVDYLLVYAVKNKATDIHIEPTATIIRSRYRIDGALLPGPVMPKVLQSAITTRLKIMANLDISITRAPQDGQLSFMYGSRHISLRFSSYPIVDGEKLVMRVLDSSGLQVGMQKLGFMPDVLVQFLQILKKPYGVILITGPTGSGKSTTLYSSLSYVNSLDKNIMTLEDPVEYTLPLICQAQVNEKAGLSFASGLRALLRQDPDILMVGEMRDGETAGIAIQAALTGHLVLSTLHTNEASGAFPRLADMGAEPFLVSSAILAVVAQRLVRKICPHCRTEDYLSEKHIQVLEELGKLPGEVVFYKGAGCAECKGQGTAGRLALVELLIVNDTIRELVVAGGDSSRIEKAAVENGMIPLKIDGLRKVAEGMISLAELERSGFWAPKLDMSKYS